MDLRELYQDVIVDHNRNPRNFHPLEGAVRIAEGYNPLCGDKLSVYARIDDGRITDVSFVGSGCAISTASASLMTEAVKGKTVAEAEALFADMHELLTGKTAADPGRLGKLAALAGVKDYPARVKCATLSWHTLHAALQGDLTPVRTE
ncbi:SUF system NifU family Fe-S cluster assembly protein [Candidatus Macondimonas diazotrophica]|jgi:nitrogen fixation NifU-like protein|nr:SUF system NifU family Fe-S cluster assembly protein [Pseudomonadota bacterium]NCU01355.1 SUF system NifU family Fe-S cluster assembly protein [Candidatus Macondimonas diazotrophica]HBG31416.1 SUF system NifU family Fe-S cluster assembly protein [Gammaproteobacteria bacterium]HBG51227.1 SUF system NifU family Fe-S cluster assembly protein [Gammaproteobacteria bacterium]